MNDSIVKLIKHVSKTKGCLRKKESAMGRICMFVAGCKFDRSEGYVQYEYDGPQMAQSTVKKCREEGTLTFELSDADIALDCWTRKLAEKFSESGTPTAKDMERVAECIQLLVSAFFNPDIHEFPSNRLVSARTLYDESRIYPGLDSDFKLQSSITWCKENFMAGDFDIYNIEDLYPALYALYLGNAKFADFYRYRETVPVGVREFLDHAAYMFTRNWYGDMMDKPEVHCSALLWSIVRLNPDCVGLFDSTLVVRKGAKVPSFTLGVNSVSAKYVKSLTDVAIAIYDDRAAMSRMHGFIFTEWGYHSTSRTGGIVYGYNIDGDFEVVYVEFFRYAHLDNARSRTKYIFSQWLIGRKVLCPADVIGSGFTDTYHFDNETLYSGNDRFSDSDDDPAPRRQSHYVTRDIRQMLKVIDQGFPVYEIVDAVIEHHECTTCDCREKLLKFKDMITA